VRQNDASRRGDYVSASAIAARFVDERPPFGFGQSGGRAERNGAGRVEDGESAALANERRALVGDLPPIDRRAVAPSATSEANERTVEIRKRAAGDAFGGLNPRGGVTLALVAEHCALVREDAPGDHADDGDPHRAEGDRLLAQQSPDPPGDPRQPIKRAAAGGG
jgi:hypothetical protein